jgi:hypothetical protein
MQFGAAYCTVLCSDLWCPEYTSPLAALFQLQAVSCEEAGPPRSYSPVLGKVTSCGTVIISIHVSTVPFDQTTK